MNKTEDKKKDELVETMLETYFEFRSPTPQKDAIRETKTTLQIQDELNAMYHVDVYDIATWMLHHQYVPTSEADGTVSWQIFRRMTE